MTMTVNSSAKEKIGLILLVLLMTGAIDNIRNLPSTATSGTYIFFFFAVAVFLFLAPVALVSAEMTTTYTAKGEEGVYGWVKKAFGPNVAMLAVWFQWINTLIWFPSILTFLAGTIAYLFNPDFAQNIKFTIIFITVVFWSLTILNLKGLRVSAIFASTCTFLGMVIPMLLMVLFALIWLLNIYDLNIHFHLNNLIPSFTSTDSWMGLTAIIASFLGLELATVHIRKVINPKKTFPLALFISVIFIIFTMVLGALAVAIIFPQSQIDVVHGTIKTFKVYLESLGIPVFFYYILGLMVFVGSIGSMINWMISPARGLLQAADDHFLPNMLDKTNKHDVPSDILILQAIIMTIICLLLELVPSVQAYYWLLTALSTQIYSLMYLMMFFAALKLKLTNNQTVRNTDDFHIPGGKIGMSIVCILGIIGTILCVIVGFVPPDNLYSNPLEFIEMLSVCFVLSIIPVVFFIIYRRIKLKN
ncbi:APC family permease [Francisella tularensis]|uniref:APC family permease n=1 Tax=Francisella tularensis TaxID=263 RepID=UPI0000F59279|nr:APC family permease [Francisella tularensis]ABO46723.1 amino acid permease [Francisella tularensis subsp. tularensis WY96-3418]AJI63575.1 amino acid permease family protein [Francisella tularensis subsp. tularensis]AKU73764.1 amino acid permease family protein [Francisella tularensis subsp. tularensis]EKM86912.1 amino acid antiporter [Francisella tularensis subsp. tularensis 831]EKM87124.1 amino acid antiporter [Francisella tularensis subsp. tularensis AS_713]